MEVLWSRQCFNDRMQECENDGVILCDISMLKQ